MTSRILLTSAGVRNPTLRAALAGLVGRPFGDARLAVVITASVAVPGDKGWLLDDLELLRGLGWSSVDVVDLNTPDAPARLRAADVVHVEGGNQYNLVAAIERHDLAGLFAEIVETKVYVGLSAGSMILSRHLGAGVEVFGEEDEVKAVGLTSVIPPLPRLDWYVKPHLDSPDMPDRTQSWAHARAAAASFPIWFLDDDSALLVRGAAGAETVVPVGEGHPLLLG